MADGGYRRPELWLSPGWDAVQANAWRAPLYWALYAADPRRPRFALTGGCACRRSQRLRLT